MTKYFCLILHRKYLMNTNFRKVWTFMLYKEHLSNKRNACVNPVDDDVTADSCYDVTSVLTSLLITAITSRPL